MTVEIVTMRCHCVYSRQIMLNDFRERTIRVLQCPISAEKLTPSSLSGLSGDFFRGRYVILLSGVAVSINLLAELNRREDGMAAGHC